MFVFDGQSGRDRITDFDIGTDILKVGQALSDLRFVQRGDTVVVSFETTKISVAGVTVADLADAGNFDFG